MHETADRDPATADAAHPATLIAIGPAACRAKRRPEELGDFRAAFESIAQAVLVVESPGAMVVDPTKLPFTRLRRGVRMQPLGPTFPLVA